MYVTAGVLPPVPLSFRRLYHSREQISYDPYHGLKKYGPYRGVDVKILHLVPSESNLIDQYGDIFEFIQDNIQRILSNILSRSGNRVYIVQKKIEYSRFASLSMNTIREVIEENSEKIDSNTVILVPLISRVIVNPDKFYAKLKAYGLKYNVVTQVYSEGGLINLIRSSLSAQQKVHGPLPALLNIALNIFAKAGGIPWTLYNATPYDLTIGISWGIRKIYDRLTGPVVKFYGVVSVFDNLGNWEYMDAFSCRTTKKELINAIKTVIEECINNAPIRGDSERVLILTREPFKRKLVEGFIFELIKRGIKVDLAVVSTTDPIRIYNVDIENYLPDKGVYCIVSDNQAYIVTTGVYRRKYYGMGTPKPIKITLQTYPGENPRKTLTDILSTIHALTLLSWRSFWGQIRLPVPLYYSSILARLMKMLDPEDIANSFDVFREYILRPPNDDIRRRLWFL